ncbi:MAG: riboflavin synthase [Thermoleophilia bacterium]
MFTGLVEEMGRVVAVDREAEGARVAFRAPLVADGLAVGDSVAVDGACLTAVRVDPDGFAVQAVAETLRRTCLGDRRVGDAVNLERALLASARLGGHIVQGHVDGTGTVASATPEGDSAVVRVDAPPGIMRYVVEKGSVCVDGVSLTVAGRDDAGFTIALIPHTMGATTLGPAAVGRRVNLEVDLVAKYVEALVGPYIGSREER